MNKKMARKTKVREHDRAGTSGVREHARTLPDAPMGESRGNFKPQREMEWYEIAMRELGQQEDTIFELSSYHEYSLGKNIEGEDGTEWIIFENYDDAEYSAKDRVREDLENEPELFTPSWLENYITMSDTDRRIIAQEESDYQADEADESAIRSSRHYDDSTVDEIQERIDELEERLSEEEDDDRQTELQDEIDELEKEKEEAEEQAIEDAREEIRSEQYDEIYDALEDPIEYFVEQQGIYSREDLLKQSFVMIDIDEATDDAVSTDGVAHFIAHYDHNEIELPSGAYAYRRD